MSKLKSLVYSAADVVTLGRGIKRRIGGADIRLPIQYSRFYTHDYEPETVKYLRSNLSPKQTFIDVGAHIGLFTVVGAQVVGAGGKVISFEPTEVTRQVLAEVVRINGLSRIVSIRGEAVSSIVGEAEFYEEGDKLSVTNSLIKNQTTSRKAVVPTTTLDELVSANQIAPNCIKIDVEGAELDVLRGARDTISKFRPKIRLSVHRPFYRDEASEIKALWQCLVDYNYNVELNGQLISKEQFCSTVGFFDVNLSAHDGQ
jgi:FkbM family methyltransferase